MSFQDSRLVFHIFGALAEFERKLIRERTYAGLAVAVDLYWQKQHTIDEICKAVGVSRPTLYNYVAAESGQR
jgi:Helix-turn-helix domain of resolvase/Resolvase, N terminal domain